MSSSWTGVIVVLGVANLAATVFFGALASWPRHCAIKEVRRANGGES